MGIYRVYSGTDGESHLEELDLAQHPELTATDNLRGLQIRQPGSRTGLDTAQLTEFHNAPNRRLATWLAGHTEVGLGDGSVHHFGPGDLVLFEDTTGRGHTTNVADGTTTVFILLPE